MTGNGNVRDEVINGVQCKVYYPSNVNSNTQVALYMHGGGDDLVSANDAVRYLNNSNNTNSIVIIPSDLSNRTTDAYFNSVVGAYDNFIKQNGINQNNLVISGFSSGYCSTFGVLNKYLEKHPNSDSASVYLIETYPQSYDYSSERYKNYYDYSAYKNNGTMFYSYTGKYGNGNSLGETYDKILNPLDDNGCNVINIMVDGAGHQGSEEAFFTDSVIDFSKGNTTLTNSSYYYQVKNSQTGKWELISANDVNTLNKIRERFNLTTLPMITVEDTYLDNLKYLSSLSLSSETVSTDSNTLLDNINNMYSVIKGSTFVVSNYVSGGGSSTTKVPSSIPDVINKYFSATSNLLCGLAVFLKKCEESNALMEKTEKDIESDAGSLGDPDIVELGNDNSGVPKYNQPTTDTPKYDQPSTDTPKIENDDSSNWQEEFPKYDELYTTENKVVFDYNNEYRVIVHHDGETITGVEYYYDFGNSENAIASLAKLKDMYENSGIENILVKDGYVKVIFNENTFNNLSVSEFRNKYSNLKEIIKV